MPDTEDVLDAKDKGMFIGGAIVAAAATLLLVINIIGRFFGRRSRRKTFEIKVTA